MYHNEKSIMVHDMQSARSPEWNFKTLELWKTLIRSPVFPAVQVSLSEWQTLGHCHQSLVIRKQRLFKAVQVELGTLGQLLLYIQEAVTLVFIFLLIPWYVKHKWNVLSLRELIQFHSVDHQCYMFSLLWHHFWTLVS